MAEQKKAECFVLQAASARDLMTPNPVSIEQTRSVREAAAVFTNKEISAVPVINEAGRPVGVLSQSDITRREGAQKDLPIAVDGSSSVREIMTPTVISVPEDAPIMRVLSDFLAFKVHRLFVVDGHGVLTGVISTFDVLRRLSPQWNG